MTFSWFCQGLLLPLQHHLKVVPFSNIFWGIFTLLSTENWLNNPRFGPDLYLPGYRCKGLGRVSDKT